ncbi:carbohydrate kinase [bacterium]|nr:MAG: carbohydrate kinase [bacterium]
MPSDELILALDNGTQSVRALLFDVRGRLVAKRREPLDDYTIEEPGWHEHDPEGFWEAACRACRGLWEDAPELRAAVRAVAVTTQRGTVINLDDAGRPLRPAITWLDSRKSPRVAPLPLRWRLAFRAAGMAPTVRSFQREAEASWIAACQPEIWRRTRRFLLLSGYLNYRLCGSFVDSAGSQVGYLPFDFKGLSWARAGDWRWAALPIEPEMLPELAAPATIIGAVTPQAAAASGIPSGTPLVAAASDKACEVLGSGCTRPGTACLSFGTTATINVCDPRYVEPAPFLPPYPAAIPNAYNTEVQVFRGYWMVNWFKEQFGERERLAAQAAGIPVEPLFEELLKQVPPGALGLMLQPYWTPGVRVPGPEAKGAIVGFGDAHTRAHLYRAIIEGLAYALREGGERIARRSHSPITSLRVCGGGAQSDAAVQITADVFGLPAARPHVYETSGLGAAIDAAVALRLHADFDAAGAAMTRIERTFEPHPQTQRMYDALYRRVYRKLYGRLRPLYAAIREITGYPAG